MTELLPLDKYIEALKCAEDRVITLEAELAALRSDITRHVEIAAQYVNDAERYRWLAKNWYRGVDVINAAFGVFSSNMRTVADRVSAAIDAARTSKEAGKNDA